MIRISRIHFISFPLRPSGTPQPRLDNASPFSTVEVKNLKHNKVDVAFDGKPVPGGRVRTKSVSGEVEMDTYFTKDGGRMDFVKVEWPPKALKIKEASLEDVRVKYGMPWPSLYHAIDAFSGSVKLRYIMDSSQESLAEVMVQSCPQCIGENALRPLRSDFETEKYIRDSIYSPVADWRYKLYCFLVDWGVYRYVASSFLGVSTPFLFSKEQISDLLSDELLEGSIKTVLDVGAGDGAVSSTICDALKIDAKNYETTEIAPYLGKQLKKRGFTVHMSEKPPEDRTYDLVLCLNVLDRCFSVTKMIDDCVFATKPGGTFVISVPLPLRQAQHRIGAAQENLWPPLYNKTSAWENAAAWFANHVLSRYGGSQLQLKRLTRSPYLSNGAKGAPLSVLDAGVFVFKKVDNPAYVSERRMKNVRPERPPIIV